MYKIHYLPIAEEDLLEITNYISEVLKAPEAAMNLVNALDESISVLKNFPYSFKVYQLAKPIGMEYRVLPVKNYLVFYVVNDQEVEIHRILYAKMNLQDIIK